MAAKAESFGLVTDDSDIPIETRRELMHCATSNGRISYHYLCDVWRRGCRAGPVQRDELLSALRGLRALIMAECRSAYECVDGERADAAIAKAEGR